MAEVVGFIGVYWSPAAVQICVVAAEGDQTFQCIRDYRQPKR